ncbi:MAG: hypothetical protein CMN77_07905 [Spirochaetaceae bacterium]|nr:hypothetical protein [Spirochaetaceae bacterium]
MPTGIQKKAVLSDHTRSFCEWRPAGESHSNRNVFYAREALPVRRYMSVFRILVLFLLLTTMAGSARAQPQTPSFFVLPQGSWEEKNGSTVLKILAENNIELSFTGTLTGKGCRVEVFGALRSEFTARPGECVGIHYDMLYFVFQGQELVLTLVNPGENYREIIFVPEGSQKDAPDI